MMIRKFKLRALHLLILMVLASNIYGEAFRNTGSDLVQQIDLAEYLERFSQEILADAKSDKCREMYEYLVDYIREDPGISSADRAMTNRYLGGYAARNSLFRDAEMYYLESLYDYLEADVLDTAGYTSVLSSIGLNYLNLESKEKSIPYLEESLALREIYYGEEYPLVLRTLVNLSAAYLENKEYEQARVITLRGIAINESAGIGNEHLGALYYNLGSYYSSRSDFSNAEILFKTAEAYQLEYDVDDISKTLAIYNGFGVVYNMVKDTLNAIANYEKIIGVIENSEYRVIEGPVYYSNYGHFLGKVERYDKALEIFEKAISYCELNYGKRSEECLRTRSDLAYFYWDYRKDYEISRMIYNDILDVLGSSDYSLELLNDIKSDLADLLSLIPEPDKALDLYSEIFESGEYFNPLEMIHNYSGRSTAYREKYRKTRSHDDLVMAIGDLEKAIRILDSLKIDFSREESRLQITGRFNYIWDNAIWLAAEHYKYHGEKEYIDDAFRYSERSKASTLLAETREIQAMEFHLPPELVKMEKDLGHRIEDLSNKIYSENNSTTPGIDLIDSLEKERTAYVLSRDSLIMVFENDYPEYFRLKHNNKVALGNDVRSYIGRKTNFVEYYLSDTLLYTFIINHNGSEFLTSGIDSSTMALIKEFRSDITSPVIEEGAREQFSRIVRNGYLLNKLLIEPVKPYLVSDKLVVAADNILSYIPFEALVSDTLDVQDLMYRDIDFLFKEYDITYTYSASMMMESEGKGRSLVNRALVFAPSYSGLYDSDSLLLSRQAERGPLKDIPGAKEEAIYISNLLGGELYLDNLATEDMFVTKAPGNKIIHLAMHTLLNDREPMLSRMVFSLSGSENEDGLLNTYEIYNLDLDAKMVVLSSCNTGSGYLQSGEGVISLARGFMYAGTPSLLMSLWEVDDSSASEILRSYYKNLKKGYSKSRALETARKKYLRSADQLRSHPYFWCSLVVMGNDEPIFINRLTILLLVLLILSIAFAASRFKAHIPRTPGNQDQP